MTNKTLFRNVICIVCTFVICFSLSSCGQQVTVNNIVLSDNVTGIKDSTDGKNAMETLSHVISEQELTQAPLFLTPDKQELYKAAYFLIYNHVVSAGFSADTTQQPFAMPNGEDMYLDAGFATYQEYITAMSSVFTESFIQHLPEEWGTPFISGPGEALYTTNITRDLNPGYIETVFELISEKETEIQFYIIGNYSDETAQAGIREEKYRVALLNTEDGWRFANFDVVV